MVAAVDEVVHRIDDGQPRAHVRLEEELDAAMAGSFLQLDIVAVRRGGCDFVGCDNRDVVREQCLVKVGNRRVRRAVHKHGVEDVHLQYLFLEMLGRAFLAAAFKLFHAVLKVQPLAKEQCALAVGNTHDIQLQSVLLHQLGLLHAYLFEEIASDCPDTCDKKVQHLVFRQKKRVVDGVEGFAEVFELDDKRYVRFRGSLRTGNHAYSRASQCAEQLAGNARRAFHVLTHDGNRREVFLRNSVVHVALRTFEGKLFVEHCHCQVGIRIADGKRRIVLRACLRHHKHANAVFRQRLEDAVVYANHADHAQALHRDKAGVVDRRDAFDDGFSLVFHLFLRDVRTRSFGVEGVEYADGDVLVVDGIDRRRIDHLSSEVAQLHCFGERQTVYHVSRADNARVGSHKAVHVRPYLQYGSSESRCKDGCRIIRAAAPEVRHLPVLRARRYKPGHERDLRQWRECLPYQMVRLLEVHDMFVELLYRLDEFARIEQRCPVDHVRHDKRGDALAIAHNRVGSLRRKVVDEIHASEDVSKLVEQSHDPLLHLDAEHLVGDYPLYHVQMARYDFGKFSLVSDIPFGSHRRGGQQLVGNASQGGYDNDYGLVDSLYYFLYTQNAIHGTYGCPAELQNFHLPLVDI